jgi:two-component system, chemotaxis family, chemotaxis protein CheY
MSKHILVVDDSESVREVVKFTLESAGYTVTTGVDGKVALSLLEKSPVDLVLTDLNMPNLDGIELIKEVRQLDSFKFTPILLLTTESQKQKKEEAKAAGATGWIVKPFAQDKLLATVKKVIR